MGETRLLSWTSLSTAPKEEPLWIAGAECFTGRTSFMSPNRQRQKIRYSSISLLLHIASLIVYADDILLIAQSVSELRNLLRACEKELITIDMKINEKKSCCMRVGPRCNANCANIQTSVVNIYHGSLKWDISGSSLSKLIRSDVLSVTKRSFFGAVNGVFGKLLDLASEVVILELVKSKCLPILLYGLECCNFRSADLHSLDFTYNRLFIKLFRTKTLT